MRRSPKEILDDLILLLEKIIPIIEMDQNSEWHRYFYGFLEDAKKISSDGYQETSVRDLCSSIRSMYMGKGPFTDYAPVVLDPKSGLYKAIPGTEDYDRISQEICNIADEIRVIGSY